MEMQIFVSPEILELFEEYSVENEGIYTKLRFDDSTYTFDDFCTDR